METTATEGGGGQWRKSGESGERGRGERGTGGRRQGRGGGREKDSGRRATWRERERRRVLAERWTHTGQREDRRAAGYLEFSGNYEVNCGAFVAEHAKGSGARLGVGWRT